MWAEGYEPDSAEHGDHKKELIIDDDDGQEH